MLRPNAPQTMSASVGFLSSPKIPTPPPPPPLAAPPIMASQATTGAAALQAAKARAAAGMGFSDTIKNLGGAKGLTEKANTKAVKSLLG